jgi:hypothetical protein
MNIAKVACVLLFFALHFVVITFSISLLQSPIVDGKPVIDDNADEDSTLYVAQIIEWAPNSLNAAGAVVKYIGQAGDIDAETQVCPFN